MERVDETQDQTSSADDEQLVSSLVSHTLLLMAKSFTHLIPMLISVLQVSSQGNNESPFKTHPVNMWIFLVATSIFCFAIQFYKTTSYFQPSIAVAAVSGSLSSVSLVSIFLRDHFLGLLIFIPWAIVPIIAVYHVHAVFIHAACHRLHQMVININISKLSIIWTWFTRSSPIVQERQRLPV